MSLESAQQAWRDWLKSERRLASHTLIAYEHDVSNFLGFMTSYLGSTPTLEALAKLKPAEFRAWLAERARLGLARTSTARAFSSVRSFFRFLDKRGLAHNASIGAIQTPKLPRSVPKALSEKDMDELLDTESVQERAAWIDLRDQAVLVLLYGAGLRIGEALALSKGTAEGLLNTGQDTIQLPGQGNKARLVLPGRPWRSARSRDRAEARARHPQRTGLAGLGDAACAASLVRHASSGRRRRPAHHPGTAGPRQPLDDAAIYRRRCPAVERRLSRRASPREGAIRSPREGYGTGQRARRVARNARTSPTNAFQAASLAP